MAVDLFFPWTISSLDEAISKYYQLNPTGGWLHIILDDGNVRDGDIEYCIGECKREGDWLGLKIAEHLAMWDESERRKMLRAEELICE